MNSTQVSNEIDPALLEELKELRQSNAQFKREIKEKDEIIQELQTRPAEPRPTIYQRTIVEVPSYVPVPGNSDPASEGHSSGFEHVNNPDSDITVQPKHDITTDPQTSSDTLTPVTTTAPRVDTNNISNEITVDSTGDLFNTTYVAKSDEDRDEVVVATNGHVKSEPLPIQQSTENGHAETKKTEKTPPSSPKALYRDPRVQDLASKLAEAERQLSIKSDEVQRLSLKLAELAERASTAPQTTIINQVVPPKKEVRVTWLILTYLILPLRDSLSNKVPALRTGSEGSFSSNQISCITPSHRR